MASKSTKGEILAKFFDDGEYTALFADGAVSAASGYAAGQQAYAVFQNGEAVSVKDVEKNIKVLELAAQTGCPVVTFYDSVGAKLAEGLDVLNAAAKLNATIAKVSGVVLDDGTKTMPCAINVVTDEPGRTVMEMTLKEGKNREIRRMCEAVGLEVIRLKRNAEGVVKLGMLQPGKYRELTKAEVNGLRAAAAKGRAQTRSAALQSKAAARRPRGPVGGNKAAAGKKHK